MLVDRGARLRAAFPAALLAGHEPLEEAFSGITGLLRESEARTREALIESMGAVISRGAAGDARGFLGHCG